MGCNLALIHQDFRLQVLPYKHSLQLCMQSTEKDTKNLNVAVDV